MNARPLQRGVTLIELMVVVAIVAILASLATASYRRYIMRANRTEATVTLMQIQVAQEKFFLQNRRYATQAEVTLPPAAPGLGIALGAGNTTTSGNYTIAVANPTPAQYTVTATAAAGQTQDTDCPTFDMNESGTKHPDPAASRCWH